MKNETKKLKNHQHNESLYNLNTKKAQKVNEYFYNLEPLDITYWNTEQRKRFQKIKTLIKQYYKDSNNILDWTGYEYNQTSKIYEWITKNIKTEIEQINETILELRENHSAKNII